MANTGDNYGAVLEALNDKMDRDVENRHSGVETVVEHWHEGTEWYRIWSDGWIEQGGTMTGSQWSSDNSFATLTFHKPFSNTNYHFMKTFSSTYQSDFWGMDFAWKDKTINTIQVGGGTNPYFPYQDWYACGY